MSGNGTTRQGAIIGFGNVAERAHLPAWERLPGFRIAAVVDPDRERRECARAMLPGIDVYDGVEPLLAESRVDFVDICTPPSGHADLVLAAFAAGRDVFCEKPLVATLEDMRRIERGARESGHVVYTVDNWKHAPIWRLASRLVDDGAVGRIRDVSISVLRPRGSGGGRSDWRTQPAISGGGILLDHGWHSLYLALSLQSRPPRAVSATMSFAGHLPLEEVVDLRMEFNDGARARIQLTWRAAHRENRAVVQGNEGRLELNDDHILVTRDGCADRRHETGKALSAGSHHAEWMIPVVESFAREVAGGPERGRSLAEAGWCARLVHCAYASAHAGGAWVPVDDPVPVERVRQPATS